MVPIVTQSLHTRESSCHRASIVEIVGVAGAGKTTLFRALSRFSPGIQVALLPPVWNIRYIPFFVKHIFLLTPTLLRLRGKDGKSLTRRELAWMAMLMGWPEILKRKPSGDQKVLLLDQGPIFLMAILSEFGPEGLRAPDIQNYWEKVYEQWISTLNMVIWLDTLDEILVNRIRTRQDEHMVKDKTDQEIRDFLGKYREAYERLIGTLSMANREIRVLKLDTGRNSVDDLVRCILQNLPDGIRSL